MRVRITDVRDQFTTITGVDEAYWEDGIFVVRTSAGIYGFPKDNVIGVFLEKAPE